MSLQQCMGGGRCAKREKCGHYHAPATPGHDPVDRLCGAAEEPAPLLRDAFAQHARLAADRRFAAWNAGRPAGAGQVMPLPIPGEAMP